METYFPFRSPEEGDIGVELFEGAASVDWHRHDFDEFVLITRGSCKHHYKDSIATLIPGDVFLIGAEQRHSFTINRQVRIYNCQFYTPKLGEGMEEIIRDFFRIMEQERGASLRTISSLSKEEALSFGADINTQGIIHLSPEEMSFIEGLLQDLDGEIKGKQVDFTYLQRAYLKIILITLKRIQIRQFLGAKNHSAAKQQLIFSCMSYIESNLQGELKSSTLATNCGFSENHFRSLFKETTGLSPIDYINRLRIVKALEYLRLDMSIQEAAAQVGILDSNYFSRLFKKIMGYSPKYFKNIGE